MVFNVKYSVERDAENYVSYGYEFKGRERGRKNLQKIFLERMEPEQRAILETAETKKEAYKNIKAFLQASRDKGPRTIDDSIKLLEDRLNIVGDQMIYFLEFLYQQPFPFPEITIYLTTQNTCPYSYEGRFYFVNSKFVSRQLEVSLHELNHFMFFYYYPHLKKSLSADAYDLLKESLAFFSNPTGTGYPDETPLRKL